MTRIKQSPSAETPIGGRKPFEPQAYFIAAGLGTVLLLPVWGWIGRILGISYEVPMFCWAVLCAAIGYCKVSKRS